MLNPRQHLRRRIPNGLAVLAALTLAATSLPGTPGRFDSGAEDRSVTASAAGPDKAWVTDSAVMEETAPAPSRRNAGFRMSLFLFRHN